MEIQELKWNENGSETFESIWNNDTSGARDIETVIGNICHISILACLPIHSLPLSPLFTNQHLKRLRVCDIDFFPTLLTRHPPESS